MKQAEVMVIKGKAKDVMAQLRNMTVEEFEAKKQEALKRLRGLN